MEALFPELKQELDLMLRECKDVSDEVIFDQIDALILKKNRYGYLSLKDRVRLRKELFNSVRKLDLVQELLDDASITEIMVNGTDGIFMERRGELILWDRKIESKEKLEDIVQQIAAGCNRIVNEAVPVVDARLSNGARVNIVLPPVAINGPIITVRRFPDVPITMKELIAWGAISEEAAAFLGKLILSGYNMFISGGTGSGKTTFLNALSEFIPKTERIITIEDNAELQIRGVSNLVRLEARKGNTEGKNEITIRDLIRSSLRMRPDRIIVGEVRADEAIDMLQAMNTGHLVFRS